MRALALVAALLAALAAGCAGSPGSERAGPDGGPSGALGPLPANITASQNVVGGLDPANVDPTRPMAPSAPCSNPPSACLRYPFTVNATLRNVTYDAALTWTLLASDFDLYLYQGDRQLGASAGAAVEAGVPPESRDLREALNGSIGPGSYEFVVDPYGVAQDMFRLTVAFRRG